MSIYTADQNQVVFLYESGTYGTASGTSGNWLGLVESNEPTLNENIIELRYTGTASRNVGQMTLGAEDVEGTLTYSPQDFRMLAFAMGSCLDAGSPSPYSHSLVELNGDGGYAYTSGANQLTNFPSFTLVDSKKGRADGNHYVRTIKGCVIDEYTLTLAQGEPVKAEVAYKAQSMLIGSKTTDIPNIRDQDTSRPYVWSDGYFIVGSGLGSAITEATEVSFKVSNSVEPRHYVNGSRVAQAMVPTNRDYEVGLTIDGNTRWGTLLTSYYQNGTQFNSILNMTISAGSEEGNIIMSGCEITEFTAPSPNEGINEFTLTIKPTSAIGKIDDLMQYYNPY
jgi:hypothetical protein